MRPFEKHVMGALVSAGIALPAAAHQGHDGGAHHGALNEMAHELAHLDPLIASGQGSIVALGVFVLARRLWRKA
jgi:hypothetical protein